MPSRCSAPEEAHGIAGAGRRRGGAMRRMTLAVAAVVAAGRLAHGAGTAPVAYVVMDARSGTVLAEHEAHKHWPPASMAKMMTVLIAMERVRDGSMSLDEPIRAS